MGFLKNLGQKMLFGYQAENIVEEKNELGYNTGTSNVVIAAQRESFGKSFFMDLLGRKYHTDPVWLVSFEDEGILLIGINALTGQYNNNTILITPEDFKDLKLNKGSLNYMFILQSNKGNYRLQISHRNSQYDYQNQNVAKLEDFVHSYE